MLQNMPMKEITSGNPEKTTKPIKGITAMTKAIFSDFFQRRRTDFFSIFFSVFAMFSFVSAFFTAYLPRIRIRIPFKLVSAAAFLAALKSVSVIFPRRTSLLKVVDHSVIQVREVKYV